ncbi:MAG: thiamine phosphate synthase [Candidatus Aenigmatarchaeota archaeon]|nr:MAG: thiamine phosphate synthase [Candidatus Aenigmarchaeota archaeon ex4484_14]RLI96997.1 MAG: thiamine phosphate synthase [Candidatus Aenigmarchaeota archaeon]RLJ04153.1 MAG: thiamine phosphate synthase [Candidatus Aenigmarchaeota archaeon]
MRCCGMIDFDLYFITDRHLSKKGIIDDVVSAIRGGVRIVQYREKEKSTREMIKEAREIGKICKQKNVVFIVDDRIDVALASGADGVHIGDDDIDFMTARKILGDSKIIGVSVRSLEDAKKYEELGADYISFGPIFKTKTKKDAGEPIGLDIIRQAKANLKIPFAVIGGINRENLKDVLNAGAERVCMISAIAGKNNVEEEVRILREMIKNYVKFSNNN